MSRPVIGVLWGDFPWEAPPPKMGKLLSMGAVARNVTRALGGVGRVLPYAPSPEGPSAAAGVSRESLREFLLGIDVLWADVYPQSSPALELRHELDAPCPALLFAGGAMPKGAEAMLFPWRRLLRAEDTLVFTCEEDQEIWRRLARRSELRERVVPLAVDETVFHTRGPEEREAARREHGMPPDAPLLIYVGRLNVQKNLHGLLRLFAAVRREVPAARLCLVGEEDDIVLAEFGVRNTGYARWMRRLAEELGVDDAASFVGPLFGEGLARLQAAADVSVNLSFYHRENFGLAQAEALACGVPVVCTAWGGFKDVVTDGETGYLVDALMTKRGIRVDWATGARRIVSLLNDPGLRGRMGERGAQRARERFGTGALADALGETVEDALKPNDATGEGPAYEPSDFARRYEDHKRECDWYAASPDRLPAGRWADGEDPRWCPPMFRGRDYELYERLLGPYATSAAQEVLPSDIGEQWVPYVPSVAELDPARMLARDGDPVWPGQRYLSVPEWEILRRAGSDASVGRMASELVQEGAFSDPPAVRRTLSELHAEGWILFRR